MLPIKDQHQPGEIGLPNPFAGIDYFKRCDAQKFGVVETGVHGAADWLRAEYYPVKGCYRILYTGDNGNIKSWVHNLRRPLNDPLGADTDEKSRQRIAEGKRLLTEKGFPPEFPEGYGYPELDAFTEKIRQSPEVGIQTLVPGKYYVDMNQRGDLVLFQYSHSVPGVWSNREDIIRAYASFDELFGDSYGIKITKEGFWRTKETNTEASTTTTFDKSTGQRVTQDFSDHHVFDVDIENIRELLKVRPPDYDPLTETNFTREEYSVYAALQGLQYSKWSGYEHRGDDDWQFDNPDINTQNYGRAIDSIINRFGVEPFVTEVEDLFHDHFQGLHTAIHRPNSRYKPHADITPLGAREMRLAKQVINNSHPLTHDMTESGRVVNVLPLFADEDFWQHMLTKYPLLFQRFVDDLKSLPKTFATKGTYAEANIDPVGVMKKYFEQAFNLVHSQRPDFDSQAAEPITIIKMY